MKKNIILNTDSYKTSHWLQYPPGTEKVFSYVESRGGDVTVFFGLQAFLLEYLDGCVVDMKAINEAEQFCSAHGVPFNRKGWEHIYFEYGGRLPVKIRAVREGSVVPCKNVLVTVENTDPECFWLTSFLETAILRAVWYGTTVASISKRCKRIIQQAIEKSSDDYAQIDFKLHDFGARGVSSQESAGIGGAAHLVNFMGSDTMAGIMFAREYYNEHMAGFSIPAAEHSTITSWGREFEVDAYRNMVEKFGDGPLYAVVSDSYDLRDAVDIIWGQKLKELVLSKPGTLVIRPDSGDPLTIPVETIMNLGDTYGYTINSKGFKVLNKVRVIQGDGINVDSLPKIINNLLAAGWAIDNLAFGMGGGLLQQVNRDTYKFAMKCSAIQRNGTWVDVYKDPATDPGKASKRGRLDLVKLDGHYRTVREGDVVEESQLETVFEDGKVLRWQSFDNVRAISNGE